MNRFRPITLQEFIWLVEYAQTTDLAKNQPIPRLSINRHGDADSCLKTPFQSFDRKHLYPGFPLKAATLFYLLTKNHVLANGNKRMACLSLAYFCDINKKTLTLPPMDFYNLAKIVTESNPEYKDVVIKELVKAFKKFIE